MASLSGRVNKKLLLRCCGWFIVANTLLYFLITINYAFYFPSTFYQELSRLGFIFVCFFFFIGLLAQCLLFSLAAIIPVYLITLLYAKRWLWTLTGSIFAALMALALLLDLIGYHLYHAHLASLVLNILWTHALFRVIVLSPIEWAFLVGVGLGFWIIEILLAFIIFRWVVVKKSVFGKWIALFLGAGFFLSIMISTNTVAGVIKGNNSTTDLAILSVGTRLIPYYDDVFGIFGSSLSIGLQTVDAGRFLQMPKITKRLNYPKHALQCTPNKKPYNIVIIAMDAWRFDMLNAAVTPNIYSFSKQAGVFKNHISGGNATGPGIFSLFYSIPGNYWDAALAQGVTPALMDALQSEGYQMGIFASATLRFPDFVNSVFRNVQNLVTDRPGLSWERDRQITHDFKNFVTQLPKDKHFFSFLFYDKTHNYCENDQFISKPFGPIVSNCKRMFLTEDTATLPYLNRYKNAIHYDDALIGEVLNTLKTQGHLKDTIVMITADHGEAFNEDHTGIWQHANGYTKWQIQVPMIVYWPGQSPRVFDYPTSHYDIAPTLMHDALGCRNPFSDYSVGVPLLQQTNRPNYWIVNSYIDYALVWQHLVLRVYPKGNYAFFLPNGKAAPKKPLTPENLKILREIYKEFT